MYIREETVGQHDTVEEMEPMHFTGLGLEDKKCASKLNVQEEEHS